MPKTPEPVKKEPILSPSGDSEDAKPMSYDEKLRLSSNIRVLPGLYIFLLLCLFVSFFIYLSQVTFWLTGQKLGRVVHIFRSLEPELAGWDPDEVVLDLEALQPLTLRSLETYVESCLSPKPLKTYGALYRLYYYFMGMCNPNFSGLLQEKSNRI